MSDELQLKVRVTPLPEEADLVGASSPKDFKDADLDRVAAAIEHAVVRLQARLEAAAPKPSDQTLGLSEVEVSFGIELEGEAKIPIIGPLMSVGLKSGATFQVKVVLARA